MPSDTLSDILSDTLSDILYDTPSDMLFDTLSVTPSVGGSPCQWRWYLKGSVKAQTLLRHSSNQRYAF